MKDEATICRYCGSDLRTKVTAFKVEEGVYLDYVGDSYALGQDERTEDESYTIVKKDGVPIASFARTPAGWQEAWSRFLVDEPNPQEVVRGTPAGGLADAVMKRKLLRSLQMAGKYRRPFDSGQIASVNVFGGTWNEYASVVLGMLTADTLLNIEQELQQLNEHLGER